MWYMPLDRQRRKGWWDTLWYQLDINNQLPLLGSSFQPFRAPLPQTATPYSHKTPAIGRFQSQAAFRNLLLWAITEFSATQVFFQELRSTESVQTHKLLHTHTHTLIVTHTDTHAAPFLCLFEHLILCLPPSLLAELPGALVPPTNCPICVHTHAHTTLTHSHTHRETHIIAFHITAPVRLVHLHTVQYTHT